MSIGHAFHWQINQATKEMSKQKSAIRKRDKAMRAIRIWYHINCALHMLYAALH